MNIFGIGGGGGGQSDGNKPGGDDANGNQNQPQDPGKGQQQQQNQPPPQEDEDDATFLASLFSEDDDSDEDDDNKDKGKKGDGKGEKKTPKGGNESDDDDDTDTPETQVANEIQNMLKKMTVPEDFIPDGFDPTDPKQFRDVVGKIQQQTAMQTMQMAFKPMQLAIANLSKEMRTEIQSALRDFGSQSSAQSILRGMVPEADDPELSGMVKTLFSQAQKKAKNPADAAKTVRKALDTMGIKSKKGQSESDPSSGGFKSGKDALDMFAPLPKRS